MGIESCMYIGSVDGEEEIGDDGRPRGVCHCLRAVGRAGARKSNKTPAESLLEGALERHSSRADDVEVGLGVVGRNRQETTVIDGILSKVRCSRGRENRSQKLRDGSRAKSKISPTIDVRRVMICGLN